MTIRKTSSTISPFCHLFDFGANAKGYWCYEIHMNELGDIVYCLKYLYPQYKRTMNRCYTYSGTSVSPTIDKDLFVQKHNIMDK